MVVFRLGNNYLEYMHKKAVHDENRALIVQTKKKAMTFTIVEMSAAGLLFKKQIDVF